MGLLGGGFRFANCVASVEEQVYENSTDLAIVASSSSVFSVRGVSIGGECSSPHVVDNLNPVC